MSSFINNAKTIIRENFKALSFASIIVLIPIMLLIITKLNPQNSDIRNLNNICTEINKINTDLAKGIENDSVNTDVSKNMLPLVTSNLDIAKKNLLTIETSNSSQKVKDAVYQALDKNISLTNQALSMYMSPDSDELDKKVNNFKNTLSLYLDDLETLKVFGINTPISNNSLSFFRNTYNYFETLSNLNALNEISNSSEKDFLLKLSDITNKFNSIKEDLQPAIKNIRENNRNLATLLLDIENKKNIFSKIAEEYYMLSFPDSAKVISESLESCINSYDLYIDNLLNAVNAELSKKSDTQNLYDSAFSKRNDFLQFYDDLLTNIDKLKNK
ncbi:hypothetical protein [uncultured Clostridium sp.]|uniref:hypothetical protein n=1 Tax=uncultured Clostridium sp. TaxID=59620 RepID=UPI0025826666|nr:hypothetical protein [uncultured Clostridium sp.]